MFAYCFRVLRATFVVISPLCLLSLMGCQNYIFHPFDLDGDNNSVSLDAKQRLVLVTRQGGRSGNKRVVCAEPSPDVYSVTAASVAGSAAFTGPLGGTSDAKAGAAIAAARNEAGASIAMRTQTIQLLRDGLYRACEAYMNGAIDDVQYNVILLNIDRLMVTLLGIDAIGGTPKVPATAISANVTPVSAKTPSEGGAEGEVKEGKEGGQRLAIETIQKGDRGEDKATQRQAEVIGGIVQGANSYSSLPMLCVSLMGSGQLNENDPNRRALFESCRFLVQGYAKNVLTDGYVKASRGKY
jgi:hypothetical protein